MSVRVCITSPPEFDPNNPASVPTSITVSGSCRPPNAIVNVRATDGSVDPLFDGDVLASNSAWSVTITGLTPGAFINLYATASVAGSSDSDNIMVVVEPQQFPPPLAQQAAPRQARRR